MVVLVNVDWIRHDLKYSLRRLIRRPGMSLLAILTLAVGLGVNTVAFSAINALIFKTFHIPNADRIGWILVGGANGASPTVSVTTFEEIEGRSQTLGVIAASARTPLADTTSDETRQVWALLVSAHFFELVPPSLVTGRGLTAADAASDAASGETTVVVSERFWESRLGENPDLGAIQFDLNRQHARIVGVMKEGYQTPTGIFEPELWMPITTAQRLAAIDRNSSLDNTVGLIGSATPGVPPDAVSQELGRLIAHEVGIADADVRVRYAPILAGHPEVRGLAGVAAVAMGAVGIVLLIACFNVAGLLLAQSTERQREMGMRAALGASRPRLIRQLLTDGLVLSVLAGSASVLLAGWSTALLSTFSLPAPIPQQLHVVIDWRLLSFAAGMSLLAALLPALVPALQVWRADLTAWIRSGSAGGSGSRAQTRARRAFLVLQVAGSTVFVIASAVFAQSFIRAKSTDPGFDTIHTAVMELDPAHYGYTTERSRELISNLTARLETTPGVISASAADRIPFFVGYQRGTRVGLAGRDCRTTDCPQSGVYAADGRHAAATGLSMRVGRWFDPARAEDRDAVVINQIAADTIWPDTHPIGQSFRDDSGRVRHIVGVVNDVLTNLMGGDVSKPRPQIYWPLEDANFTRPLTIVLRASGAPDAFVETMRRTLHDLAPEVPPQSVGTMQQRLALPLWPARTLAGFFGICGLLALVLATVGLFGVTHYVVSQRTREFGVRLAIGASDSLLQRMVVGETLRLIAPGILIGLAGGIALDRLIKSQMRGMESADVRILIGAVAIEIAMATVAAWLPARRAGRTNPLEALRAE